MKVTEEHIWQILKEIPDPEVPVLNLLDLGIIREVKLRRSEMLVENKEVTEHRAPKERHIGSNHNDFQNDEIEIIVTPTYSGCPATSMINMSIRLKLIEKGFNNIKITNRLSPAWTTDWMTEEGKQKLKAYGIAPPVYSKNSDELFSKTDEVECPLCGSKHTHLVSQFGSTACKALYQCDDCREPFDYFKCH
ncbi:1,2-phenylacetyl-CoA epoxidase subunit PaaD [Epilithonimonas vandammei]|uniref:1,2-phenylacetyl-CoA epoxidase subunit PaaD n=1 Tax=Epilithonimonas vandammei TaxID=2487072 RepID=UPI00289A771A|nr:1,2-phenylacetyl-CoA epoxidase subunit PaaD [Epilithonimonas vandammei]